MAAPPDNYNAARMTLGTSSEQCYIYDSLFVELEDIGLARTTDCYQLASYVRVTCQITRLLQEYDPAHPTVYIECVTQKGEAYTKQQIDDRHVVYRDLLAHQTALAQTLGVDPKTRARLLMEVKRVEAATMAIEMGRERMIHARIAAKNQSDQVKIAARALDRKLELMARRMDEAYEMAKARLHLVATRIDDHKGVQEDLQAVRTEMLALRKEAMALREREVVIKEEKHESANLELKKPPRDIQNPVAMLREVSTGRKKQLRLKEPRRRHGESVA